MKYLFAILCLIAAPAAAQCKNGQCQNRYAGAYATPYELRIAQKPCTVEIQPAPVVYRKVQPASFRVIWVPQRAGLFGMQVRYAPVWVRR